METKHTLGPWNTKISKFSHPIYDINAKLIATSWKGGEPHMTKAIEAEANAKLMSLSPELLEALNDMYETFFVEGTSDPATIKAFEVLKKLKAI